MAVVRPPPHELKPSSGDEMSNDNAEQSVLLEKPEKERFHQLPPPRREIYVISAKLALVFIFAISYLTFCYIVHYHHVPIGRSGVLPGLPLLRFSTLSAITTVAILIVYVALWPIKGLIDEIRAEEFFRLMHTHPNGVPLDSVNAVSATTNGAFDIFMATIHRHCSSLLTSTLVISLVITATSSIAPAALSAGSIWVDLDNSTLLIGALPKDSFLVDRGYDKHFGYHKGLLPLASTMAWVENTLNLTNGYYKVTSGEGGQFEYLVPFPSGYTSTMKAHWTTDVIILDPSCSWQSATTIEPVNFPWKSTWEVMLPKSNLSLSIPRKDGFVTSSDYINTTQVSFFEFRNASAMEFTVPVDGSVLFVIDQLDFPGSSSALTTSVDLSSIPTLKFPQGNVLAFLLCSPHISIQTRQVWATGNGNLTLGKHQPSQGNIDFYQANYLLSYILIAFPTDSGPTSSAVQLGTDMMFGLIFGTEVQANAGGYTPPYMPPAPLTNITAVYKQAIHSAMKIFLAGEIATENVPGGYPEEQVVFTSSLSHVITSATLFVFLTIVLVAAQFRKGRVPFTLVNVAAALVDSDLPQRSVEMTQFKEGAGERKVLKLVPGGDGQLNCVYQSIV